MNETRANKGLNPAILLLIPAALIVAKAVRRHSVMWESGWTPSDATGHGYGRHMRSRGGIDTAASSFRLPPKIEWMLDTWHTRAHEKADATHSADSTAPDAQTV